MNSVGLEVADCLGLVLPGEPDPREVGLEVMLCPSRAKQTPLWLAGPNCGPEVSLQKGIQTESPNLSKACSAQLQKVGHSVVALETWCLAHTL